MSSESGIQEQPGNDGFVEAASNALVVVSQELMETIRNAHLALEDCVDGRGGTAALVRSGQLLHQVLICSGSQLAPFTPFEIRGCFPGLGQPGRPQLQEPSSATL